MDGNGRWAKDRGLPRTAGHEAGESSLFDVVEGATMMGISFSENAATTLDSIADGLGNIADIVNGDAFQKDATEFFTSLYKGMDGVKAALPNVTEAFGNFFDILGNSAETFGPSLGNSIAAVSDAFSAMVHDLLSLYVQYGIDPSARIAYGNDGYNATKKSGAMRRAFDAEHGGFGTLPKFPYQKTLGASGTSPGTGPGYSGTGGGWPSGVALRSTPCPAAASPGMRPLPDGAAATD